MTSALLLPPIALFGGVAAPEVAVLLLLGVFVAWGAYRGAVRQLLSVLVLGLGFLVAGRFGAALEPTVAKVARLPAAERTAVAWGLTAFGALVLGAIIVSFLGQRLAPRSRGRKDRVFGGLLGLAKGAFVLVVAGYTVLGWGGAADGPPVLSRSHEQPSADGAPASSARLVDSVRGTPSASWLAAGARFLTRWLPVPAWIRDRIEVVNRKLEVGAGSRARASSKGRPVRVGRLGP